MCKRERVKQIKEKLFAYVPFCENIKLQNVHWTMDLIEKIFFMFCLRCIPQYFMINYNTKHSVCLPYLLFTILCFWFFFLLLRFADSLFLYNYDVFDSREYFFRRIHFYAILSLIFGWLFISFIDLCYCWCVLIAYPLTHTVVLFISCSSFSLITE